MSARKVSTDDIWDRLFEATDIYTYIKENGELLRLPSLSEYLAQLCERKGERRERIIKRGCIESSYGHHVFRGSKRPSRDTLLQLAFGFELDATQAQQLLKIAQMSLLYPQVKRDAVILYGLQNRLGILEVQSILAELELPVFGSIHTSF